MAAGENTQIENAQLSDELLQSHLPFMINNPSVGDFVMLTASARWPIQLVDIVVKTDSDEVRLSITINDALVEMDKAGAPGDVDTDGYILADVGAFVGYEPIGDTGGDDEIVEVGQSLKVVVMEVTTGDTLLLGEALVQHIRDYP